MHSAVTQRRKRDKENFDMVKRTCMCLYGETLNGTGLLAPQTGTVD